MEIQATTLLEADVDAIMKDGCWVVSGGRETREMKTEMPLAVREISGTSTTFVIATSRRSFVALSNSTVRYPDGWTIEIMRTYTEVRDCKKSEGGGKHAVQVERVALRLKNPKLEEAARTQSEQAQQEKELNEKNMHEEKRKAFVARLSNEFVGKTITSIDVTDTSVSIELNDGSKLSIELEGETYDASMSVNDIDLGTFEKT